MAANGKTMASVLARMGGTGAKPEEGDAEPIGQTSAAEEILTAIREDDAAGLLTAMKSLVRMIQDGPEE